MTREQGGTHLGSMSNVPLNAYKRCFSAREMIKALKELGGLSNFEAWLAETNNGTALPATVLTLSNQVRIFDGQRATTVPVVCNIFTAVIYTRLDVSVTGTSVTGNGSAWGVGFAEFALPGNMTIPGPDGLQGLIGLDLTFSIFAGGLGAGSATILFHKGDELMASIVGFVVGGGVSVAIDGSFKFL